ncbi:hypothetical protein PABY_00510 [Pyrodictium abyssi]|uniref:Uncharacterized protein n=1 Tax=Pyrodictium abyssi TaxID=54256 RepID=A0ABM8IVI8_9CREN|nr:hypothetical protein PABY_00510 [Pyrodictium abyssi]
MTSLTMRGFTLLPRGGPGARLLMRARVPVGAGPPGPGAVSEGLRLCRVEVALRLPGVGAAGGA